MANNGKGNGTGEAKPQKGSDLGRLMKATGQGKGLWYLSGVLSTLGEMMLIVPIFVAYFVAKDYIAGTLLYEEAVRMAIIAAAALVARVVLKYASLVASHVLAFGLMYKARMAVSEHIGKLPLGFFGENGVAKIKKVWAEDCDLLEGYVAHNVPDLMAATAMPVITAIVLAIVDWRMAIVSIIPIPLSLLIANTSFIFDKEEVMTRMHGFFAAKGEMYGTITEYVYGMPAIKVFNLSTSSFRKYRESIYSYRDFCNNWTYSMLSSWAGAHVVVASALAIVLPAGAYFYLFGGLTLPALVLFLMMGVGLSKPMYTITMIRSNKLMAEEASQSIMAILAEPPLPDPVSPETPVGSTVEFADVSFSYGDGVNALDGVNFVAKQGEITALVGPSGAGKSTVASLTGRLWDIDSGKITIGGADVRNIPFETLQKTVSSVFQKPHIFADTVYNNIAMAKEGATAEEVREAARKAMCCDFIEALPEGLHTPVGEGGIPLSGGERQRISIARAILKDAPVLVLDEATAFTDPENEDRIQGAIASLVEGRTVIVIAHRLSVIAGCDNIVVLDGGKVVETGPHAKLAGSGGLYGRMWESHVAAGDWKVVS